jgi:hypothetical protein
MADGDFRLLQERLLSGGVAPRHVGRLVMELASHYELLLEEEMARGQPVEVARSVARNRLGTDDEIAQKVLEQRALRSWGVRWPLGICGLAPVLGLAASAVAVMAALVAAYAIGSHLHAAWTTDASGVPSWARYGTEGIGWLIMYGLPVLWSWALAQYAATRRLRTHWLLTGFTLTAALGAATNVAVIWPRPGVRGALSGGLGLSTSGQAMTTFGMRWLITFALAIGVYYYLMGQRPQAGHRA